MSRWRLNLTFLVASRYLVSRKSHNIINIISGVSVAGVTVGTMALIVVLSVFNGFEGLVTRLFNTFNPDIEITPATGKTFTDREIPKEELCKIPGVINYTEVVIENALIKYREKQYIATLKGVSEAFTRMPKIDSMMISGSMELEKQNENFAVPGYGIAYALNLSINDFSQPIEIYAPKRKGQSLGNLNDAFIMKPVFASGVFSIQQELDTKFMIVPLRLTRELYEYTDELTSVEICLSPGADAFRIQDLIMQKLGPGFIVKNRFQQEELLYKIMRSEKTAVFLILAFILMIATFNVIGSLTMLVLEKKKDMAVLWSLGADDRLIRRIFFLEGILIILAGAFLGLFLGALLCFLQEKYGLIGLNVEQGSFLVNAYPVKMKLTDFFLVFVTVVLIGLAATWLPVKQISRKLLEKRSLG